jgi:probable F420-dependent oxidoreductase
VSGGEQAETQRAPSIGLAIPLDDLPLSDHRQLIERLPSMGYSAVWAGEASGLDAVTPIVTAAAWAPALHIGTSILPASTRGPGLLAMTAAALGEAAPGRAWFGVGASSPAVVQAWNDRPYDRPVARVRDTMRFLRAALAGERVSATYDTFSVDGFRLDRVPAIPPHLLVAALRPRMLEVAAAEADGAVTTWLGPTDVGTVAGILKAHDPAKRLSCWVPVCPSDDAGTVRALARRLITGYLTVPGYARFQQWLGRGELLAPMWAAWDAGDRRAALAAVPDEVVDDLIVHGTPEQCWAGVQRFIDAGVDMAVVSIRPLGISSRHALTALGPVPRHMMTVTDESG